MDDVTILRIISSKASGLALPPPLSPSSTCLLLPGLRESRVKPFVLAVHAATSVVLTCECCALHSVPGEFVVSHLGCVRRRAVAGRPSSASV